jgi:hypothetical protein
MRPKLVEGIALIAFETNCVVAILVELSPEEAVGALVVPDNVGSIKVTPDRFTRAASN